MRMVPFSSRTAWSRDPSTTALLDAGALDDLTESNPTRCALFDAAPLVALLGDARGCGYSPDARGEASAREAVARYYAERAIVLGDAQIVLSASTSEAYGWLFKLLCDRGDEVLVARPSYPLFDYLAGLEDVVLKSYPLHRDEGFRVDVDALRSAVGPRTRAILLVHPNNPTGSFVRRDDAEAIEEIASENGLALIVDEVFGDYAHGDDDARLPSFAGRCRALTFAMSGLSKVVALPQLKLGWTIASGPKPLLDEAMARLEIIADTYLSVGTPVQRALPEILSARSTIQTSLRTRVATNLAALDAAIATHAGAIGARRLPVEGGWYALVEVPRVRTDEAWVQHLADHARVLVHPGYFFDFEGPGTIVVSLLPAVDRFADAVDRLARALST